MKHPLLLCLAFVFVTRMACAQSETREERFVRSYEAFVSEVAATPASDFHGDTLNHFRKMQRRYMRRYRWCYDTRLSLEQLEQFNKLCGRYKRKMNTVTNQRRWVALKARSEGRIEEGFRKPEVDTLDTLPRQEGFWKRLFKRTDKPTDTLSLLDPAYL